MSGVRIGVEEWGDMAAGIPAVVLAPGTALPPLAPLLALTLAEGEVLRRAGVPAAGPAIPLPEGARLLALIAPDAGAALPLQPLLPAGLPVLAGEAPLPALLRLLAAELRDETRARTASEAARAQLLRAVPEPPAPADTLVHPPGPGRLPPRVALQLDRPAAGLAGLAVHLAAAACGPGSRLRARLLEGDRLLAAWAVPGPEVPDGWLALDLPEPLGAPPPGAPAPPAPVLELLAEAAPSDLLALSPAEASEATPALRLRDAGPGWSCLPRHYDWTAPGLVPPPPGIPLPLPEATLAAATVRGATLRPVALGGETTRLLLEVSGDGTAELLLPPLAPGPADLLRVTLATPGHDGEGVEAALILRPEGRGPDAGAPVVGPWRGLDGGHAVLALPLPAAPLLRATLSLRVRRGTGRVPVEVSGLALMAALAPPPVLPVPPPPRARLLAAAGGQAPPPGPAAALPADAPRPLPGAAPDDGAAGFRGSAPVPHDLAPPAPGRAAASGTAFQDLQLHQHLVSPDGGYRHLDMSLVSLVSAAGLWRMARFKLFDRRGTVGVEFRELRGWPQMFDVWPGARSDGYGPFWRLESDDAAGGLMALARAHDRALIAALMAALPAAAAEGARAAALPPAEVEAWVTRAEALRAAVGAAG